MPTNRKVIDFKIHNLTEEQFQELKEAGQIDPNAIYCTPDETVANFEAVNARIDETNKNLNTVDKKVDEAIQTEQQHNIEINARVDETDDKLDKKVSVVQGEENAGKVLVVNEDGEVVPDKPKVGASLPILTHVFADHKLNDISWLNADTFSWQSGDVYKAAYEHLVNESSAKVDIWIVSGSINRGPYYYRGYIEGAVAPYEWWGGETVYSKTPYPVNGDKLYSSSDGTTVSDGVLETKWGFNNPEEDTIGDITIEYFLAEDGHKICASNQEANVQALYEKTGVAWYYILDIVNKQFKLPREHSKKLIRAYNDGYTWYRLYADGWVEQGGKWTGSSTIAAGQEVTPTVTLPVPVRFGNVDVTTRGLYCLPMGYDFTANDKLRVRFGAYTVERTLTEFDWSVSGMATTTPEQNDRLYFYVGNFERDALEQTAGITSEQLNNKADVSDVVELQNNKLDKSAEISLVPTGSVTAFAGTTPPAGWLKCDGSAVSRTTYAKLFTKIGGLYGTGDGSTTFNLPNLHGGRVPVGMSGEYVGQSTNGVLPNITGGFSIGADFESASGAFSGSSTGFRGASNIDSDGGYVKFNASLSNPIYGNGWYSGEKVIPASVGMTYCIKY